jgi:hypothetical protein
VFPTSAPTDLRTVAGEQLEAELTTLAAHLHAGMGRFLLMVAEFDRRQLYQSWECRSTAQWLSWKCSIAPRTAREHVHVARALEKLPVATAAFASGTLSYAKVRAMARVADVVPEAELMNLATAATAGQLERILATFARHHNKQTKTPEARQQLRTWWDDNDMLHLAGTLTAEDAAILLAAMATMNKRRMAAENGSAEPLSADGDPEDSLPETQARGTAEDLIDIARAALGLAESDGPPVDLLIHADVELLTGSSDKGRAWIDGGPPLSPDVLRRLGCDASWRLIIEDRERNPLYVGRKHREPNTSQRVAVWSRSGGHCENPNCTGRMRHIHHVWWWSKGGPTNLDHLLGLCSRCHPHPPRPNHRQRIGQSTLRLRPRRRPAHHRNPAAPSTRRHHHRRHQPRTRPPLPLAHMCQHR